MKLSIAITAVSSTELESCFNSLNNSERIETEVIINNALELTDVSEIIKKYGYIEIKRKTNIMDSRYELAMRCTGDYILIMDDTRRFSKFFLNNLPSDLHNINIIDEFQEGSNCYSRLMERQNTIVNQNHSSALDPEKVRFLLPRLYKASILKSTMKEIKNKLPESTFSGLRGMDLELIYFEAAKLTLDIRFISSVNLRHSEIYLLEDLKKFYKYGKNTRELRNSSYRNLGNLRGRMREFTNLNEILIVGMTMLIRGLPFAIGYLI